ncbi:beta-1,6-N-acetylglucosaminyltransferase [Sphingomonas montanisoli]|uniref:beta-1,6-N-acetylglucosaminyltransferase n=1 Tax=Sphingomonas montanisoli TaxID=2606412 RepID=UPI0015E1AEFD|nr:beta-1,6-N-acetylglucosaminyltransferase [Sphingomonas montanisoli]
MTATPHAYLIAAHADPVQLGRLIAALRHDGARFFIHIDRKSDIAPFRERVSGADIVYIDDRVDVRWGGWSQVAATLALIRAARQAYPLADYLTFMSGTHFPIRSNADRLAYVHGSGRELINIVGVPSTELGKPMTRFTRFFFEGAYRNPTLLKKVRGLLFRAIGKLPLRNPAAHLGGRKLYAGSSWWTLSAEAIGLIEAAQSDSRLTGFFRHTMCPDEAYFQTILGNSPLLDRCVRTDVYTDWSDPVEKPCHLKERHLPLLLDPAFRLSDGYGDGPAHYARKLASSNVDIVDAIEHHLAR